MSGIYFIAERDVSGIYFIAKRDVSGIYFIIAWWERKSIQMEAFNTDCRLQKADVFFKYKQKWGDFCKNDGAYTWN